MSGETFDPANSTPGVTLSSFNSTNDTAQWTTNLSVPNSLGQTYGVARTLGFRTAGKFTFSFKVDKGNAGAFSFAVGMCTQIMTTNGGLMVGQSGGTVSGIQYVSASSFGWFNASAFGQVYGITGNGFILNAPSPFTQIGYPAVGAIAVDLDNQLMWVKNLTTNDGWSNINSPYTGPGGAFVPNPPGNPSSGFAGYNLTPMFSAFATVSPAQTPQFYPAVGFTYLNNAQITMDWSTDIGLPGFPPWNGPPPPPAPPPNPPGPPAPNGPPLLAKPVWDWPDYADYPTQIPPILYR